MSLYRRGQIGNSKEEWNVYGRDRFINTMLSLR